MIDHSPDAAPPWSLWLYGSSGKMGSAVKKIFAEGDASTKKFFLLGGSNQQTPTAELENGLQSAKAVVDFSSVQGNAELLEIFEAKHLDPKMVLLGTTGLEEAQIKQWKQVASQQGHRILFAPNTSLGIIVLSSCIKKAVNLLIENGFDCEIQETHHRMKKDAPSGTAMFLSSVLEKERPSLNHTFMHEGLRAKNVIGMQATRGGGVFGEHSVRFLGDYEEIMFTHRAYSRDLFAKGALSLLNWLQPQKDGQLYTLSDVQLF